MNTRLVTILVVVAMVFSFIVIANAWTPVPVKQDPLVRMPGSQPAPENNIVIEGPGRCTNCHGGFDTAVEPAFNWLGSMMMHAARDFMYWSCLTVGAQDSIWAVGRPNATDICLRCHMPKGWLEGRSDPTNGSAMTGDDFSGVQCDFCHDMFDPFFETTFNGTREGSDWLNYWDETNLSATPSNTAAQATYNADMIAASAVLLFNGGPFYTSNLPPSSYMENASGQYFMTGTRDKRASFADASARHDIFYSRYHKSKYFCSACHDVSNPILANYVLGGVMPNETQADFLGTTRTLWSETHSAGSYFHVERTFSEFMLSDYGRQGGAAGIGPYDPAVFKTSYPNNWIAKCQDCHMRDGVGKACSQTSGVIRPTDSIEHPNSGQPIHDLTGGNAWVSFILASTVVGSANYDLTNDTLLNQGPPLLTLDLSQGEPIDPVALLAGVQRAKQQLKLAAAIQNVSYSASTGSLSFRIQNQTGHKLISGFPEGRRMFVNIKAYQAGSLISEVNPYDYTVGTLKGLPLAYSPNSPGLGPNETYIDSLVYETHPTSALTGEHETFHFALATGRYKDNRIPPKGFRIAEAADRISQPVDHGVDAPEMYTSAEYAGGFDDQTVTVEAGADYIELTLYYQTTSREYVEFLRDEIKGTGRLTLTSPTPSGEPNAYVVQSDQWFTQLKAWGDTIWQLWTHNMNVDGAKPFMMTRATWGMPPCATPGISQNLTATGGRKSVALAWSPGTPIPTGGYNVYEDQAGKLLFRASVPAGTTTYTVTGLMRGVQYCYRVTAWNDCNGNGAYDAGIDNESGPSNIDCATTR
ncbi:MAG: hypothetical protein ACM34I_02870 [bacterium]